MIQTTARRKTSITTENGPMVIAQITANPQVYVSVEKTISTPRVTTSLIPFDQKTGIPKGIFKGKLMMLYNMTPSFNKSFEALRLDWSRNHQLNLNSHQSLWQQPTKLVNPTLPHIQP